MNRFNIAAIIITIALLNIGCGNSGSSESMGDNKMGNDDSGVGQCALDFSLTANNFAMLVVANDNFPSIAGNNFTVEAWVKPSDPLSSAAQGIFGRYDNAGVLLYVQDSKAKFTLRQSAPSPPAAATSTDYTVSGTTTMAANIWYHIAGVVVNKAHTHAETASCTPTVMAETPHLDIYVDGNFENCATTWDSDNFVEPQGVADPDSFGGSKDVNIAYIGSLPGFLTPYIDGNAYIYFSQFHGTIDEVRLWTVARTAADITACKDAELTFISSGACEINSDNLKGYWKMNECGGYYVYDWSGGGSIGRIEKGILPWVDGWVDGVF